MRFIALTILFVSQVCFAKTHLIIGSSSSAKFTAEVASNPMQVVIENTHNRKNQTISFPNSVSDIKKLTITKSDRNSRELLLVVLSVSDKEQAVKVLDLGKSGESLCSLRNEGDFSWVDDQDLMGRLRLDSKGDTLQIKIGNRKSGSTKFAWMNCFSI